MGSLNPFSEPDSEVQSGLPEWADKMGETASDLALDINERGYVPFQGFNESQYLAYNPDVAAAVEAGDYTSGEDHYNQFGSEEGRQGVTQGQRVAGLNQNQQNLIASPQTSGLNRDYFQPAVGYAHDAASPFSQTYDPTAITSQTVETNKWSPEAADQYMNPYIQEALDPSIRNIEESAARSYNTIGAKAGARGAFGGLRQGILESGNEANMLQQVGDTTARGYKDAYDTAFSNFSQDEGRGLQGDLANQATDLRTNEFNENQQLSAFEAAMQASDMNSRNALASANTLGNLAAGQVSKEDANFDRLMRAGAIEQGQEQAMLDDAYSRFVEERDEGNGDAALDRLLKVIGSATQGEVVQKENMGSKLLGTGLQVAALAASDINLKENITKVGEVNGFNTYEYNYTGTPQKFIGVIAQEVAKIVPEAVREMFGFLAVDYSMINVPLKIAGDR